MVAKKKTPKKQMTKTTKKTIGKFGGDTKKDTDKGPKCSKCNSTMELVRVIPEDNGRSLRTEHKCPKCVNMWSIRTLSNVSNDPRRNPTLNEMEDY